MKKQISIILALFLLLSAPVFAADHDIVDIAVGNEDFSILVAALQEAGLVEALQGEGPFTVFAPTNAAFEDLLDALNITAGDLLAHPQLSEVLLYHVVSGTVMSTDLMDNMTATTLSGEEITVDLSDGVKINSSNVTTADIEADNGVIHVIDTVLVPSSFVLSPEPEEAMEESPAVPGTVVDIALSSEDFSILVAALQQADLVGALQGEGPFTVFAPTNAAFEELLAALNISASDLLNQPDLAKVLLYHVVPANVMSTDLSNGMIAATLNGEEITVDLSDGVKINNSQVIAADIVAGNGVVHVIDEVMVPQNFVYQSMEENTEMPQTGSISLTPYFLMGILSLAGAGLVKKRYNR